MSDRDRASRLPRGLARASASVLIVGVLLLTGCSTTNKAAVKSRIADADGISEFVKDSDGKAPEISELCGSEPITIAIADSYGQNAWHKITTAEVKDELASCDNVTIKYTEAGGDAQKYVTQLNAHVAQGVDGIMGTPDVGEQSVAAMRNAMKAGIAVVPYDSDPGGKPGTDYTVFIDYRDPVYVAEKHASWLNERLRGAGKVLFLGGTPGAPSSQATFDAIKKALTPYPGITFLQDGPVATNWEPAETQRVVGALINKYPEIDAIVADYGAGAVGSLRAYENAKKPHPYLATGASSNELGCYWHKVEKSWADFDILSIDGSTRSARLAVRKLLAQINRVKNPEPNVNEVFPFIDTLNDKAPCEEELPPDADLSSALTTEQLMELFG